MWIGLALAFTCVCRSSLVAQRVSAWENKFIDHRARSPGSTGGVVSESEAFRGGPMRCATRVNTS